MKLNNHLLFSFNTIIEYCSINKDKTYLAVSTQEATIIFSDFLSQKVIKEQSFPRSSHHRFSDDGKYFVTSDVGEIRVYINCNWNTSGGYFYEKNSETCLLCAEDCIFCEDASSCSKCDEESNYQLSSGLCKC